MEGYSVTEAASVLGVPTERVWELLARGVLSGTPDGESGMRVFLQPRPAPPAVDEPRRSNGHGDAREADAEASPFRELLTEFRNLTERYGQALLALGEARGEVASLRSRVDVLEARMDLRLPLSSPASAAAGWAPPQASLPRFEPPPPQETRAAVPPVERPTQRADRADAPKPAPVAEPEPEEESSSKRKRGRPHFRDDFADALARAEDPSPAVLPGAAEAGAAFATLRYQVQAGDVPTPAEADSADAALPRELPAAESIAVDEPASEAEPAVEAAQVAQVRPEPITEPEPAAADIEPLPDVAPDEVPEPAHVEAEQVAPEPDPSLAEPIEAAAFDSSPEAPPAPEPAIESWAEADAALEPEPVVESPAESEPDSAAEPEPAPEAVTEPERVEEPEPGPATEPGETPEPAVAPPPLPEPAVAGSAEPSVEGEPEVPGAAGEPEPGPTWDPKRYTAQIEEPDWWTPEDTAWPEPAGPSRPEPMSAAPTPDEPSEQPAEEPGPVASGSEPVAQPPPSVVELPPDALPTEPYVGEETMLWFGRRPEAAAERQAETVGWPSEDAAGEMEVASTGRRGHVALPGGEELEEALGALDAAGGGSEAVAEPDEPDEPDEPEAPWRSANPPAPRPASAPNLQPGHEPPSTASRAYRRLRRIFPG